MYVENLEMNNSLKWALFIKVSGQITSNTLWKRGEVFFLRIWRIFLFLRAVVNIPIQTLIIPPWLLLRKMIISQLELGLPVDGSYNASHAHFQPWCNARRDPISYHTKFPDHWKPSKIVFLRRHPGHIVNCFTVSTFAVPYFTVSLQYFEFCPEESEENFFLSVTLGSLRTLWTESAKRTTFKFFHFLEALEDSKWR